MRALVVSGTGKSRDSLLTHTLCSWLLHTQYGFKTNSTFDTLAALISPLRQRHVLGTSLCPCTGATHGRVNALTQ